MKEKETGKKIQVKDLSLKIGSDVILDQINAEFESGKIYGLIGRNGSGKTMLMKCICGYIKPTEGEIWIDGKRLGKDMDFPEDLGTIIEVPGFIPYYSGMKNLKLLAGLRGKIGKQEIREAIEKVGLNPDLKKAVSKYSLGMRQRLGIAQAVMEDPAILVLDEPMNGLDVDGVEDIRGLLETWRQPGKLVILASHMEEDIRRLCDVVYRMEKGRLKEAGQGVS